MAASLKRKADNALPDATSELKKPKTNGAITSFFGAPSSSSGSSGSNTAAEAARTVSRFDKSKWALSLTAEQKKLLKLEIDTLHETYLAHLKEEILSEEFLDLKRFLQREVDSGKKMFPPLQEVYSWYDTHGSLNGVAQLTRFQVTSYTSPHGQSGHHRPRSLS